MAKKRITIELTPEQAEQLQPFFDVVKKKPHKFMVLGQAWDTRDVENVLHEQSNGKVVFELTTPKDILDRTAVMVAESKA